MQFYVHQDGQQLGPFTEAELKAQLASGAISPRDLVWWEGQAGWAPLEATPHGAVSAHPPVSAAVGPDAWATSVATVSPVMPPAGGKTSGMAIAALVTGILFLFFSILFFIPVILGHVSLAQIRKDPTLGGRGMALAGLILGYVEGALCLIAVLAIVVLLALGQQVRSTFNTINAQLQQAETNSPPATNAVPGQ